MNHTLYIAAAYGITIAGTAALMLWSWLRMRAAERRADASRRDR